VNGLLLVFLEVYLLVEAEKTVLELLELASCQLEFALKKCISVVLEVTFKRKKVDVGH
jgi:hypothetical protein